MIKESVLKERQKIEVLIINIQEQLNHLPEGTLYCTRNGKYTKWYQYTGKEQIYIPKKQKIFAEQLAKKKYLIALLKDLTHEKDCLDLYLNKHIDHWKSQALLAEESAYQQLLQSVLIPQINSIKE